MYKGSIKGVGELKHRVSRGISTDYDENDDDDERENINPILAIWSLCGTFCGVEGAKKR